MGLHALASTSRLNELQAFNSAFENLPVENLPQNPLDVDDTLTQLIDGTLTQLEGPQAQERLGKAAYNHDADTWGRALLALAILAFVCLAGAGIVLRRHDPL